MTYLRPWLFGVLISLPLTSAGAADCTLKKVATFDAKVESGALLITAKIDGRDVPVTLDTGSPYNLIDTKLVSELNLPITQSSHFAAAVDAAGRTIQKIATAHTVDLGVSKTTNTPFLIGGEASTRLRTDALFGTSFLEANDLELDLAHGKVNIFLSDHCPGQGVYWAREYVPIPIRVQKDTGHIFLPVALDGFETIALLDTGAGLSVVDKRLAEGKLDVPTGGGKDKPDGNMVAGSGATIPYYKHTFGTFDIGGLAFRNAELAVMRNRLHHANDDVMSAHITLQDETPVDAPIILGLPHIAKLRMYFSFKENMLYVTPANAQ